MEGYEDPVVTIEKDPVPVNPNFEMWLFSADCEMKLEPSLCSRVCVVSFEISTAFLLSWAKDTMISTERPDVWETKEKSISLVQSLEAEMTKQEEKLLHQLETVKMEDILTDERLIATLSEMQDKNLILKDQKAMAQVALDEIDKIEQA